MKNGSIVFLFKICAIISGILMTLSCEKDIEQAFYKYDGLEELQYIIGEESTLNRFMSELASVMNNYDGTFFTENEIKSDVRTIAEKYDNGILEGTFYLTKANQKDGYYSTIESYALHFNPKYSSAGNNPQNKYDFEFTFHLSTFGTPFWSDYDKCYVYMLQLGFGTPYGLYDRGISKFGIELKPSSGAIQNKSGLNDEGVYVQKNGSWTYFRGNISSNSACNWFTWVYIYSKNPTIDVSYRWKLYDEDKNSYVTSEWVNSSTFSAE